MQGIVLARTSFHGSIHSCTESKLVDGVASGIGSVQRGSHNIKADCRLMCSYRGLAS